MNTVKPIGTISYNTPNYLANLLDSLWRDGILDDYRAIFHYAESEGKKDHFHLNLFPASRIDTTELRKRFEEPDPFNKLPLSCEPFRYSEPLNWLLYVLHDQDYLLSHPKRMTETVNSFIRCQRSLLHIATCSKGTICAPATAFGKILIN